MSSPAALSSLHCNDADAAMAILAQQNTSSLPFTHASPCILSKQLSLPAGCRLQAEAGLLP